MLCLCSVESSPLTGQEYITVEEMSELAAFDKNSKHAAVTNTSLATMLKSQQRRDGVPGCKQARKSRQCIKNEPSGEFSVGKTTHHRQYHRPLTPDTSPIRLLPFSPSQVVCLSLLSVFNDTPCSH